jgi:GMP synthase-like glutamine amidotransferase
MRVLSVTHGPNVPGGVFDETVVARGHRLERWEVPLGGLPQPPTAYDAVLVFGGSMHPDQDDHFAWLASEAEFLVETLQREVPALGVCLGAQMLARAAGAWVGPATAPEVGWLEVALTPAGRDDPVLGTLPETTTAFQWHHYTFAVPEGGTELARSELCTQAFRLGERAWGLQFHAEVTLPMLRAWVEEEPVELPVPPEDFVAEAEARIDAWNEQGRRLCAAFLEQAANGR